MCVWCVVLLGMVCPAASPLFLPVTAAVPMLVRVCVSVSYTTACNTQLADLDEPLEDQEGFIYEGVAIRGALQHTMREDGFNWIECPLPGVSHRIMLHNLKPANKRRLQRMAKLKRQQQQQAGTQAGHGRVVLDA